MTQKEALMTQTDPGLAHARLLPTEAYPEGLDDPGRDLLDAALLQQVANTETKDAARAPVTALFGPRTRAPEERISP